MSETTYKSVELIGTSDQSFEDAVESAVEKASRTLHGLRWFQVIEHRGRVENGEVVEWQAKIEVWFHLDD